MSDGVISTTRTTDVVYRGIRYRVQSVVTQGCHTLTYYTLQVDGSARELPKGEYPEELLGWVMSQNLKVAVEVANQRFAAPLQ